MSREFEQRVIHTNRYYTVQRNRKGINVPSMVFIRTSSGNILLDVT